MSLNEINHFPLVFAGVNRRRKDDCGIALQINLLRLANIDDIRFQALLAQRLAYVLSDTPSLRFARCIENPEHFAHCCRSGSSNLWIKASDFSLVFPYSTKLPIMVARALASSW